MDITEANGLGTDGEQALLSADDDGQLLLPEPHIIQFTRMLRNTQADRQLDLAF